jgi:hypothetical protein
VRRGGVCRADEHAGERCWSVASCGRTPAPGSLAPTGPTWPTGWRVDFTRVAVCRARWNGFHVGRAGSRVIHARGEKRGPAGERRADLFKTVKRVIC